MDRSKRRKKDDSKLTIIYVLGGIIALLIVFIIFENIDHKKELDDVKNLTSNNILKENKYKKNNNMDFVVDADYIAKYEEKTYKNNDRIMSISDLKVPYININSTYGDVINNEIKQYYDKIISIYDNLDDDEYLSLNYDYYLNNNTLSVVLTTNINGKRTYKTYNISLEDGKIYEFDELLNTLNYKKKEIKKILKEKLEEYVEYNDYDEDYIDENIDIYEEKLKDGELLYYINSSNKLTLILPIKNSSDESGYELIFCLN